MKHFLSYENNLIEKNIFFYSTNCIKKIKCFKYYAERFGVISLYVYNIPVETHMINMVENFYMKCLPVHYKKLYNCIMLKCTEEIILLTGIV